MTLIAMAAWHPDKVWRRFADAIGADALRACYGWARPPAAARAGERVWIYAYRETQDVHDLVGWGSLIKDPTTALYWHASGVFPAYQGQGIRQQIRRHLCTEAFARGAEAVSLVVLDTNQAHLDRCHREAASGSPWQPSGRVWRPAPGHTIFTLLREDAPLVTGIRRECSELHTAQYGG